MKKTIILTNAIAAMLISSIANAGNIKDETATTKKQVRIQNGSRQISNTLKPHVANRTNGSTVSIIDLGGQPNSFGMSAMQHSLHAVPVLNTIACIFRTDSNANSTAAASSTGNLKTSYSFDGGTTWTKKVEIYTSDAVGTAGPGTNYSAARYPQGLIYNPAGNITPTNAYVHYFATTRNNSNPGPSAGDWGGQAHGVVAMHAGATATQTEDKSDPGSGPAVALHGVIPDDFRITSNGVAFAIDQQRDPSYNFEEYFSLAKGVFNNNTHDFDYTRSFVKCIEADINTAGNKPGLPSEEIAFAPDGTTGYISAVMVNCISPDTPDMLDSTDAIVYMKTTDGGTTWSRAHNLHIDSLAYRFFYNHYNPDSVHLTVLGEHSTVCDKNGNLHIIAGVARTTGVNTSIYVGKHNVALVHFFTEDGGTTWKAALVGLNTGFRGTFNSQSTPNQAITEDYRPRAAVNVDGSKVFLGWFDSDSTGSVTDINHSNNHPNMMALGYDVTAKKWTPTYNMTKGTVADSLLTFGVMSPVVLSNSGVNTLPVTYQQLPAGAYNDIPNRVKYVNGLTINDSAFHYTNTLSTPVHSYIPSCVTLGINDKLMNNTFVVMQNYPNPVSGSQTIIPMILNHAAKVKLTATNVLGQVVYINSYDMAAGDNSITLNKAQLTKGIIFYTIEAEGFKVTHKMVVE